MATTIPAPRLHGDAASASTPQAETDRKELAFVAMERTRMPMVVTDPRKDNNPIVLANHAFLQQTGYSAEEVIGRNCRFLQGPETHPLAVSQVRAALSEECEVTVELINYRKDGTPFWNQLYISPIHDDDGRLLYFFASQMDTTRQHEASDLEAAEHLLLREVDHRAKNALALVQGIVRLTKRDDADVFASAVQGRVDALARAHSILADAHWRNVPLHHIVRNEVGPSGTRIHADGDNIELPPAYVQPVALLLHELAANARNHGALSVISGRLAIEWMEDATNREVRIRWIESGGPEPAKERTPGYGHSMIDAITARQLRGRVSYSWEETGLVADLAVPAHAETGRS